MNANILSLPDEVLMLIFSYLNSHKTTGSFQAPRHAFALAQTNKRFLRIFSRQLTSITPDFTNTRHCAISTGRCPKVVAIPPTHTLEHVFAAARLARDALQEIHLPDEGFEILPDLLRICPNLNALSLIDSSKTDSSGLLDVRRLSLRSLTICNPSSASLRLLAPAPPKLTLTSVKEVQFKEFPILLCDPPRILELELCMQGFKPLIDFLLRALKVACPKIEAVSITTDPRDWDDANNEVDNNYDGFLEEAASLIAVARGNDRESLCTSIKLSGKWCFQLLSTAHPDAIIELSRMGLTCRDEGDGLHVLTLPRLGESRGLDFSRLREVNVQHSAFDDLINLAYWKDVLSQAKLKYATVGDAKAGEYLRLSVETVQLPILALCNKDWNWLSGVCEVRVEGTSWEISKGVLPEVLEGLRSLADAFEGEVIWMANDIVFCAGYFPQRVREVLSRLLPSLDYFEHRGGDCGTVRAAIDNIQWRPSGYRYRRRSALETDSSSIHLMTSPDQ